MKSGKNSALRVPIVKCLHSFFAVLNDKLDSFLFGLFFNLISNFHKPPITRSNNECFWIIGENIFDVIESQKVTRLSPPGRFDSAWIDN